jgi:hypothetical protein
MNLIHILKQVGITLVSGFILMFFSEFLFYGQLSEPGTPVPGVLDVLFMWLIYSLMAYLSLAATRYFHARNLAALFLVGAIFGWLLEGIVVTTVYEALPFSISFTGLAWHAPIDFVLGLVIIPHLLRDKKARRIALVSAGLGLFWGFWALWIWFEFGTPIPVAQFAGFSFLTIFLLGLAYWLIGHLDITEFRSSKWSVFLICGALTLMFVLQPLLVYPFASLILPLGLGISLWALRHNRLTETKPDALSTLAEKVRWKNLLALGLFPVVASTTYALYVAAGLQIPANWPIYVITTFSGFALFGWSVYRLLRARPVLEGSEMMPKGPDHVIFKNSH